MSSHRPPAGKAQGALFGDFPANVSLGLVSTMGLVWIEDFAAGDDNNHYGEKRWEFSGTGSSTVVQSTATSHHEAGLRLLQVQQSGRQAVLHQDMVSRWYCGGPPPGMVWATKLRHNTSPSNAILWAGFADTAALAPDAGLSNSLDFVGIRNSGSGNWFGVVRSGTAETSVDLNVAGSVLDSEYLIAGFQRTDDGYAFFVLDCRDRSVPNYATGLDPITTNLPAGDISPVIGIESTSVGTKGLVVDLFNIGGRTLRQ